MGGGKCSGGRSDVQSGRARKRFKTVEGRGSGKKGKLETYGSGKDVRATKGTDKSKKSERNLQVVK